MCFHQAFQSFVADRFFLKSVLERNDLPLALAAAGNESGSRLDRNLGAVLEEVQCALDKNYSNVLPDRPDLLNLHLVV